MKPDVVITSLYLLCVLFGFGLALYGRLKPEQIASLDDLLHHILRHRITRISLFVLWWWTGWHFLMPGV